MDRGLSSSGTCGTSLFLDPSAEEAKNGLVIVKALYGVLMSSHDTPSDDVVETPVVSRGPLEDDRHLPMTVMEMRCPRGGLREDEMGASDTYCTFSISPARWT